MKFLCSRIYIDLFYIKLGLIYASIHLFKIYFVFFVNVYSCVFFGFGTNRNATIKLLFNLVLTWFLTIEFWFNRTTTWLISWCYRCTRGSYWNIRCWSFCWWFNSRIRWNCYNYPKYLANILLRRDMWYPYGEAEFTEVFSRVQVARYLLPCVLFCS